MSLRAGILMMRQPWPARERAWIHAIEQQCQVVGVYVPQTKSVTASKWRLQWKRISRNGVHRAPFNAVADLLYRRMFRRVRSLRNRKWSGAPSHASLPITELDPADGKQIEQLIARDQPDCLFNFGFGIIREPLLSVTRLGVFGLHHGIVPVIRGLCTPFWAVAEDRPDWLGITLQKYSAELDAGDIVDQVCLLPQTHRDWAEATLALDQLGMDMMIRAVHRLQSGSLPQFRSVETEGDYRGVPTLASMLRYQRRKAAFFTGSKRGP
jgi:hypothetical protein